MKYDLSKMKYEYKYLVPIDKLEADTGKLRPGVEFIKHVSPGGSH